MRRGLHGERGDGAAGLAGISDFSVVKSIFVVFLLVDQEICCTFAVALFGNESEKAV